MFQFGSVPASPKMGCVRMDVLASKAAAFTEFDQMVFTAVIGLANPSGQ